MSVLDPIEGLVITNFRSLRGTVPIPLDAPIVLIHGANGAGKTSILSALELPLTREIPAMRRDDQRFEKFLVHQGQNEATIRILLNNGVTSERGSIKIANGIVSGEAFLNQKDASFFSDRCMLAQSILGRLLKVYQDADPTKELALTHFVKDLLKLDQLDAVIDGLHDANDVRNVRKLVPSYKEAEDVRNTKRQEQSRLLAERNEVARSLADELKLLQDDVGVVLPGREADAEALEGLSDELLGQDVASRLLDERGRLNQLASLEKAWAGIADTTNSDKRSEAELRADEASANAENW